MHKFVRDLITEWRRLGLPFNGGVIVAAVSGGADSLSLLLALDDLRQRKKLDLRLVAAHFNHKLRGAASDADEEFIRHLATEKGIELAVGHGPIDTQGNIEQNARNARYAFLTSTAENLKACGVVAAHTMNDQAETFLLNLIRGSGVDGLSGMRPIRSLNAECGTWNAELVETADPGDDPQTQNSQISLIRPLLSWARREDTENFCRQSSVEFRYDTMNEDMSFKRVRVRKILLPVLTDLNPKIVETLARTAGLLRSGNFSDEIETGGTDELACEGVPAGVLLTANLKTLDKTELYQTLRSWLRTHRGDLRSISFKHIESIERLIFSQKSGRLVELPGGGTVSRGQGRLTFGNIKVDK